VAIIGSASLVLYDVVTALQPITFGRVYADYGGIFIALALLERSSWKDGVPTGTPSWLPSSPFSACWY
jgi:drug/metabolite transporter superfamily protein YnfA